MSRAPRDLTISPQLARALAGLRDQQGVDSAPRVNLDRLQDVEAALAVVFADDVLALFAAGVTRLGTKLEAVVGISGELKAKRIPGDYIGLGEIEPGLYAVLGKGTQPETGSVIKLVDSDDDEVRSFSVLEYVRTQGGAQDGDAGQFRPVLFRPAPESTTYGKRVVHKVFGEGSLLSEVGNGPTRKCKVDFPGHGLKVLQARFLEFPDPPK